MPFMIFGGFGIYIYRHVRRTKLAAEAAAQSETVAKSQAVPDAGVLTSV
jgi:hypothetical protein